MKKTIICLAIIIVIISSIGCVSAPPATEQDKMFIVNNNMDDTFNAIKQLLFNYSAEIVSGSKESGYLNARVKLKSEVLSVLILGEMKLVYSNYQISFIEMDNKIKILLNMYTAYSDGSYPSEHPQPAYQQFWTDLNNILLSNN